jgi:hypothetical protein
VEAAPHRRGGRPKLSLDVARRARPAQQHVVVGLVVQSDSGRGGLPGLHHGRKLLILDAGQLDRILGLLPGVGDHRQDRLPHEPHPLPGQEWERHGRHLGSLAGGYRHGPGQVHQVVGDDDVDDAGVSRSRYVDREHARVRQRAAQHRQVGHSVQVKVVDERPLAPEQGRVLAPA